MVAAICCLAAIAQDGTIQHNVTTALTHQEAASIIAIVIVLIIGLWLYRRAHLIMGNHIGRLEPYKQTVMSAQQDTQFLMREYLAQPREDIPIRNGERAAARRPQIAVFTDFECSACYCKPMTLKQQVNDLFGGNMTMLVRHYPLSSACNPAVEGNPHPNACDAACTAEAARCLRGEVAFWRMHEGLFANQSNLCEQTYRQLAMELELDADELIQHMRSPQVRNVVADDVALAERLGVTTTPTLFLDGRRITELCDSPLFWQTVAKRLVGRGDREMRPAPVAQLEAVVMAVE